VRVVCSKELRHGLIHGWRLIRQSRAQRIELEAAAKSRCHGGHLFVLMVVAGEDACEVDVRRFIPNMAEMFGARSHGICLTVGARTTLGKKETDYSK
jgi:hypothetical protein